ncbi:MAG: zf-HC2 domain-containing protein [Anaerotignum sp.]|nr:zf-HC2 domain-containing protein [Anaerotignum sp.]
MNCEAVREMLWAYLEKELTAAEAVKIEEHLKNCADCREELKFQQEMMETLSGLPDEELPDGYHAELMQKLQVEAAPNVVSFPVKKKKQPVYKQWGMIAAAVMVVVAAGGMNGMLEMRESQNAAVQEMQAKDMAAPANAAGETMAVYDSVEDVDSPEPVYQNSKTMSKNVVSEDSVVYEGASVEESLSSPLAIVRTVEVKATDSATLTAENMDKVRLDLEKAISIAEGYEEVATEEDLIIAVIPVETFASFVDEMENMGTLVWTMQAEPDENMAFRTIEIKLN